MKLTQTLYAFIPKHIKNALVLNVWNLMRGWQKFLRKDFSGHLPENEKAFLQHACEIAKNRGYIEDQNNYTDMLYGKMTMQYSGCQIFAAYNAIFDITGGYPIPLPQMIAEFEKDGMVSCGRFGTAPKAIRDFLQRHGFGTELATEEKEFDQLAERCQSLILTMYNDRTDIRRQLHSVCISKNPEAAAPYTAHNVYCNGKALGPCDSVTELIKQISGGRAKGISLIGIHAPADRCANGNFARSQNVP